MNPTLYATTTDTLTSAPTNAATIPYYDSNNLFKNKKIVTITHEGRSYQLRITSSNKLILTA
ncbi:MAG: hemin uptake protein HemP [Sulfuriferula sp.]|nr:hemin uptake protein HemP [Sulfuriferula sp.]